MLEQKRLLSRRPLTPRFKNRQQARAYERFIAAIDDGRIHFTEVDCPVCGLRNFKLICNVDRQSLEVETVRCLSCPTLYSRRRMTEKSLEIFYSEFYRELYGGMTAPNLEWFNQQSANGSRILQILSTNRLIDSTPSRILEIGTGAGGALLPFMNRGDDVVGIDFDEQFLEFGRSFGLTLHQGGLELLDTLGTFDVVILKDVLEHLPNPRDTLRRVAQHLSPMGVIYVQVPGLQALGYLGYRYDLLRYLQIAHVCHYTVESLTHLGRSVGLMEKYVHESGKVVFARQPLDFKQAELEIPSPKFAEDALRNIFQARIPYALRLSVTEFVPEGAKIPLRWFRDALKSVSRRASRHGRRVCLSSMHLRSRSPFP